MIRNAIPIKIFYHTLPVLSTMKAKIIKMNFMFKIEEKRAAAL